ncbi:uncharacterized protein LOC116352456 [Contarinia nasturtii]|uniref:uncharacterized protein LOC116352456 n=1 Tax=Contarinia nasturtii TaxID=265458 RepID=UPI0012D3F5FB|nr:uncharacterized protein LOC116352456 [Contarinia nasturtii]
MKYFLVLLAGVGLTMVTAANPKLSSQEFEVFSEFDQRLQDYGAIVRCVSDVVTEAVAGSEFESVWEETRANIKRIITVEWEQCSALGSVVEQIKCKVALVQVGVESILNFSQQLIAAKKWDLVRKIKDNIVSKCLKKRDNFFEFDGQVEQFDTSLAEEFKCLADVLGKVSQLHGLEALWKKSQPQLEHHIGKWKQCSNAGNTLLVVLCNIKEGVATFSIVNEYIKLASAQDATFMADLINQYKESCGAESSGVEMFAVEGVKECVRRLSKRIKCISEAISDAVKDTSFQKGWEEYKNNLDKLRNHLKACKNEPTTSEAAKCIRNELKYAHEIFSSFLSSVKQTNIDAYNRIIENIKKRCYA